MKRIVNTADLSVEAHATLEYPFERKIGEEAEEYDKLEKEMWAVVDGVPTPIKKCYFRRSNGTITLAIPLPADGFAHLVTCSLNPDRNEEAMSCNLFPPEPDMTPIANAHSRALRSLMSSRPRLSDDEELKLELAALSELGISEEDVKTKPAITAAKYAADRVDRVAISAAASGKASIEALLGLKEPEPPVVAAAAAAAILKKP